MLVNNTFSLLVFHTQSLSIRFPSICVFALLSFPLSLSLFLFLSLSLSHDTNTSVHIYNCRMFCYKKSENIVKRVENLWNKIYMVRLVKFCHEFFILYDDVFFICLDSIVRYMSIKRSLEMCNISWDMPIKGNPVKAIYKRTISIYV